MTRALTAAVLAEIAAKDVQVGLLAELNTDAGAVRVWSGIGNLLFLGNTFTGVGHLGSISPIQESGQEVRANALTLQLSGIPSSLISTALTTQYQGRDAKVWLGFFEPAVNPYALSFDGVDDEVSVGDVWDFAGAAPFSVEFWCKVTAAVADFRGIISKMTSGGDGWQVVRDSAGVIYFERRLNTGGLASVNVGVIAVGSYNHIAFTFDGTNLRAYLNGVLVGGPTADALSLPNTAALLKFGRGGNIGFANIVLDESRIWDLARTQPQLSENRFRRLAGTESGFVGYWRMDEGSGTQAKDATANANHGTLSGGAAWTTDSAPLAGDLAFSTPGLIADPVLLFQGRMDTMQIEDGPETATITVTAESRLADLTRPRVRRYTDQDQQNLFPGDKGLEFVASLQDAEIHWGAGGSS